MVNTRKRTHTPNKRSRKSLELRKYEIAYNKCIKLGTKLKKSKRKAPSRKKSNHKLHKLIKSKKLIKSRKASPKRRRIKIKTKSRSLNRYQKFVKTESSKSVYKGMNVQKRMKAISKLWRSKR